MKNPSIKSLIEHNKRTIDKCKTQDLYPTKYRAMGWVEALNYITNNYNLEEK